MTYKPITTIPNYEQHPLSDAELRLVGAAEEYVVNGLNALREKNGTTGMMVKIEIVAVLLTQVLEHAVDGADAIGIDRSAAQQAAIDLVVGRAREIYGQDMA